MGMSKHTPGPWFVGGVRQKIDGQQALGIFRFDADNKRDENIASVWYDPRDGAGTPDARLIAAAPDMLEALKTAKETIRAWHGPNAWDIYDRVSPEMRVIDEAIAKATGSAE